MSTFTAYGSLDDLVTAALADFARCGIDCLAKLTLLESAWLDAQTAETVDQYVLFLNGRVPAERVRAYLEQLVDSGLFVRDGLGYRLNDSPRCRQTLTRLRDFWADRDLRGRAAAQLRYRLA